jgi:Uma2 family endonuclease
LSFDEFVRRPKASFEMNPLTYDVGSPARPVSQRGDPTWEVTLFFPRQGEWTEDDYLSLGTNWMIEFSDGILEVLPMPTLAHQMIVEWLYSQLKTYVLKQELPGRVLFAPLPIRLWAGKYREPDIVYLNRQQLSESSGQPSGADFVVEVVSEGTDNRRRDLEVKPQEYAAAGIAEYWIVDPLRAEISVLVLDGLAYRRQGVFERGQAASSIFFPGFSVAVNGVLDAGSVD